MITLRAAVAADAEAIGAVFDAAVQSGWTFLGPLAAEPMFGPEDWDQLVEDHAGDRRLRGGGLSP